MNSQKGDTKREIWENLKCRSFFPWRGRWHPHGVDTFSNLEALRTPHYWGFTKAFSHKHDQLLTPCPATIPSMEKLGVGKGLKIPSL